MEFKKWKEKNKVLESAKIDVRKDIVLFEKGIFPFKGNVFKIKENELKEESKEYINNTSTLIEGKSKDINNDLFTKYFNFLKPIDLVKKIYETKDAKENSELLEEIKNRLSNLKDETKKMSEDEKEIEQPDKILKIVKEILDFNQEIQKRGLGLKILAPDQMLSRLPISLAQLNAGNNSEKLKNQIRQILYSLYRSKNLTKQLYKSLIEII